MQLSLLAGVSNPTMSSGSGAHVGRNEAQRYESLMKTTSYFSFTRSRPDRAAIRDEWIEATMTAPEHEVVQPDGRIRRWRRIADADGRYLRVVLLADGETVHNAFFDRRFQP